MIHWKNPFHNDIEPLRQAQLGYLYALYSSTRAEGAHASLLPKDFTLIIAIIAIPPPSIFLKIIIVACVMQKQSDCVNKVTLLMTKLLFQVWAD